MGRAKILCPHGILGVAQRKICQREQHTDRVRELRRQKRELKEQEETEEKVYRQENPAVVYISSTEKSGKGTVKDVLVVAKELEPSIAVKKRGCGSCVYREYCKSSLYYRLYPNAKQCPSWKEWPTPKPIGRK